MRKDALRRWPKRILVACPGEWSRRARSGSDFSPAQLCLNAISLATTARVSSDVLPLDSDKTQRFRQWLHGVAVKLTLLIALSVSAGCRVGPDYRPPSPPCLQAAYRLADGDGVPIADADLTYWWTVFEDPLLHDLIIEAGHQNYDLWQAYYRIQEARAQWRIVRGGLLPQVENVDSYEFRQNSANANQFVPLGNANRGFNLLSAGLEASWEIDVFGRIRRSLEASTYNIGAQDAAHRDVKVILLGDIAATYTTIRTLQRRLEIAQDNLELQQETLSRVTRRVEAGLARPLDQHLAESNVHLTGATIPQLRFLLEASINRLAVLIGTAPSQDLVDRLGEGPIPASPFPVHPGFPGELLRRRPDIRQTEQQVAAANARIGSAIADYYPQFTITGDVSVDSRTLSSLFTSSSLAYTVGPSARWNLLNFGRISGNVDLQRARFQEAVAAYRQSILLAVEEVENGLASYREEVARRASLAEAVKALSKAVTLSQSEYQSGLVQFQTVLDAERQLLLAQGNLADAEGAVTLSVIQIFKALGGGWDADLCNAMPMMASTIEETEQR